jgi:acyl-CoA synthetase (AMP-forming)/AMP-acid ligase II
MMIVPLTLTDFIDRAAVVYGDRVGVVDEPDQPAESLGALTYEDVRELAIRQAARLDELGVGLGERVAIVSHNSARLLASFFGVAGHGRVLVPVNFRLRPEEISYIVSHCGARVLLIDPELDDTLSAVTAQHRLVLGTDDERIYAPRVPLRNHGSRTRTPQPASTTHLEPRPGRRGSR